MNLIDLTRQSMNWDNPFRTRQTNQIRRIGVHHSATDVGGQFIFENHWRSLGWRNGGYHEIILLNGDVEICYVPTTVVNGVGDHNMDSYHICVVGNFRPNGTQPSAAQMRSLLERIRVNTERFNISVDRVLGHNEFANTLNFNHSPNSCPGQNMNALRNQLRSPSTTANKFTVTERIGGFFTAADARSNQNRRTWIEPGEYFVFTEHGTGAARMINVSRLADTPGSWINPRGQGWQSLPPDLSTGRRIELHRVALFASSTGEQSGTRTGTHWIWSSEVVNNRIRITNQANRVGVANQVTGWVRISDII